MSFCSSFIGLYCNAIVSQTLVSGSSFNYGKILESPSQDAVPPNKYEAGDPSLDHAQTQHV